MTGVNNITTGGNVTVGGDLQVNGTTTSVNTDVLEVEDANITVNKNGNQASADVQDAGLTVEMSDATDAVIGYDSTLASKFAIGEAGSTAEIADVSSAQTLTGKTIDGDNNTISNLAHGAEVDNPTSGVHGVTGDVVGTTDAQILTEKDIDGGTASNTSRITIPQADKATLDGLNRKEGTLLYANDLDTFFGDNGTDLFEIGSGVGEKNYFDDGNFENNIDLATTYNDGGSYVDGTGGTPTVLSVAQNTTTPLEGGADLAITKAASDAAGEGVTLLSESIDRADRGRPLYFSLEVDATDANYTSGDLELRCYDVTNAEIINILPISNLNDNGGILDAQARIQAVVYPQNTTEQVRVSLHTETDSATGSSWTVNIDDAKLRPDSPQPSAILTEWQDFTPTGTWTTNTTYTGHYRRVGDMLEVEFFLTLAGAPNASNLQIDIPFGLEIDSDKISNLTNDNGVNLGLVNFINADSDDPKGIVGYATSTRVLVKWLGITGSIFGSDGRAVNQASPFTFTNGDAIYGRFQVPIVGWSAGNVISTIEASLSSLYLKVNLSSNQTGIGNSATKVQFDNVLESNGFASSFDTGNNRFIAPRKGRYTFHTAIQPLNLGADDRIGIIYSINGVGTESLNFGGAGVAGNVAGGYSTVLDLEQDDFVEISVDSFTDTNWDVQTSSRLTIVGEPDFSVFGTYGTYEVVSAQSSAFRLDTAGFATGEYPIYTGNSVVLSPGTWRLEGMFQLLDQGANPVIDSIQLQWSTENGDNTSSAPTSTEVAGILDHKMIDGTRAQINYPDENFAASRAQGEIITITEETEIFLNSRIFFTTTGDGEAFCSIIAERLR